LVNVIPRPVTSEALPGRPLASAWLFLSEAASPMTVMPGPAFPMAVEDWIEGDRPRHRCRYRHFPKRSAT
jgi:hypothetical protein